ncbi:MAG: hypothetical protein R3F62_18730 [Planctomycetota bacterium]
MDQRTAVLGLVAAGMVGILALRMLGGDGDSGKAPSDGPGAASVADVGTPLPVGAPPELDLEQLEARYATIGAANPFAPRDFRPKREPTRRPGPSVRPSRTVEVAAPPPDRTELRLTGFTGEGAGRVAVFEVRAERKMISLASGWELEDVSIAAIHTLTVQATAEGKERTLELGDALTVPKAVSGQLVDVTRVSKPLSSIPVSQGGTGPEPISEEKRNSILERLRARREASLKAPTSGD